jgi:hypothetical protein
MSLPMHSPGCSHVSDKKYHASDHVNGLPKSMAKDIKKLGWFRGMIHGMMKQNPMTRIAEALGEGEFGNAP